MNKNENIEKKKVKTLKNENIEKKKMKTLKN